MRIHSFEHVDFEGLGNIEKWANEKKYPIQRTFFYQEPVFPQLNDFDMLIVMGGPMSVYEELKYPWLKKEKEWISLAIENNKKVLGICLGSQLIAEVLGAQVYQNREKEIGWFPIEMNPQVLKMNLFADFPELLTVFHWHGDTYKLPQDALRIASSKACENQGFIYKDHVLALQFHLEMTFDNVNQLVEKGKNELIRSQWIQNSNQILSDKNNFQLLEARLFKLLNRFISE